MIETAKLESQKEPKEINKFIIDIGICGVRALVDAMIVHEKFEKGTPVLLGVLRDGAIDQSLKMAVVEGFLRILISEKSENPENFICAMIL